MPASESGSSGEGQVLSFEVQIYIGGQWRTDASYDSREVAEKEANRALESNRRPPAVRVVRESVDPATNLINSTTVYRRSRVDEENKERRDAERRAEEVVERAKSVRADARSGRGKKARKSRGSIHRAWLVLLLVVLLVGGMVALVQLHNLLE